MSTLGIQTLYSRTSSQKLDRFCVKWCLQSDVNDHCANMQNPSGVRAERLHLILIEQSAGRDSSDASSASCRAIVVANSDLIANPSELGFALTTMRTHPHLSTRCLPNLPPRCLGGTAAGQAYRSTANAKKSDLVDPKCENWVVIWTFCDFLRVFQDLKKVTNVRIFD